MELRKINIEGDSKMRGRRAEKINNAPASRVACLEPTMMREMKIVWEPINICDESFFSFQ